MADVKRTGGRSVNRAFAAALSLNPDLKALAVTAALFVKVNGPE
jgi:hypothetical protein